MSAGDAGEAIRKRGVGVGDDAPAHAVQGRAPNDGTGENPGAGHHGFLPLL